jgi:hypothetical protein
LLIFSKIIKSSFATAAKVVAKFATKSGFVSLIVFIKVGSDLSDT